MILLAMDDARTVLVLACKKPLVFSSPNAHKFDAFVYKKRQSRLHARLAREGGLMLLYGH